MKFYSTNDRKHRVTLKEAVINGLAPDNGLYMPESVPKLPPSFFETLTSRPFAGNAFTIAKALIGDEIPDDALREIVRHTLSFDAPLVPITKKTFCLELFHGPTLAFKDFGARFMSRVLAHFSKGARAEIVVLVATSGDTGSAVANGFLGVAGTRVVILYPSGKVSNLQERQFTTLGENIAAIEVSGTFDDCQRMVKEAFGDRELRDQLFLTSANSINIARLIPQSFYYVHAWAQLPDKTSPVAVAVPSGNFGNLTAGMIAKRMGLPIAKFVIATNANDVVPSFLKSSVFEPRPSVHTISNAMDVGNPSNLHRMLDLYDHNLADLRADVDAFSITDDETREVMTSTYEQNGYILDPHGAVAFAAINRFMEHHGNYNGIFLETAHPGKFEDVVADVLRLKPDLPPRLSDFLKRRKKTWACDNSYDRFRDLLFAVVKGGEV